MIGRLWETDIFPGIVCFYLLNLATLAGGPEEGGLWIGRPLTVWARREGAPGFVMQKEGLLPHPPHPPTHPHPASTPT